MWPYLGCGEGKWIIEKYKAPNDKQMSLEKAFNGKKNNQRLEILLARVGFGFRGCFDILVKSFDIGLYSKTNEDYEWMESEHFMLMLRKCRFLNMSWSVIWCCGRLMIQATFSVLRIALISCHYIRKKDLSVILFYETISAAKREDFKRKFSQRPHTQESVEGDMKAYMAISLVHSRNRSSSFQVFNTDSSESVGSMHSTM